MFFETICASLGSGVLLAISLSLFQNEKLDSLNIDENGNLNPMLKWWIFLSIIHVGIVISWAYLLYYYSIIKLYTEIDPWWIGIPFFFSYWTIFESVYYICHYSQHKIPYLGILTGHKGELSEKFHHGMKPPYGPDYLTAFSAHPIDDFIVQFSAQSPWLIAYVIGMFSDFSLEISYLTYGITLTWLVFIGMRAHARNAFGGSEHCKHHDDPSKGPYSFSGIPEHALEKICNYFK